MLRFIKNECGAVTIEWVSLTAGGLLLGMALVWVIFSDGVGPLAENVSDKISTVEIAGTGDAPELND